MTDTAALPIRPTSAPGWQLPERACDSHAHIFGPFDRFPTAADAAYEAAPAPVEAYVAMLDALGATRGVLVQAAPYRDDNAALLDALRRFPAQLRGIAVASPAAADATLVELAAAGVCGLRFSYFPATGAHAGTIGLDGLMALAPRMREHGLHAQLWMSAAEFVTHAPRLLGLGIPLVLDHMNKPEISRGPQDAVFQRLLGLLRDEDLWVKLVPHRVSDRFPDYADLQPFHAAFLQARPDRLLWGTDWPFVRMGDKTPDAGHLADLFAEWTGDLALRQQILAGNPARLYGFG